MREFELVVPAYNEARTLEGLIRRAVTAAADAGHDGSTFQLVVVNNGSADDSRDVLDALSRSPLGAWFRVVDVAVNRGYGFGVWSGLTQTSARFVGWTHADLQCDPRDAFVALAALKQCVAERCLVKGTRTGRNWKDRFVTTIFELTARLILGLRTDEINAQPKVFPRALLDDLSSPPHSFAFDLYVLYRAEKRGYHVRTVPVSFPPRIHGVSRWAATFFSRYRTILGMVAYMWRLRRAEGTV